MTVYIKVRFYSTINIPFLLYNSKQTHISKVQEKIWAYSKI